MVEVGSSILPSATNFKTIDMNNQEREDAVLRVQFLNKAWENFNRLREADATLEEEHAFYMGYSIGVGISDPIFLLGIMSSSSIHDEVGKHLQWAIKEYQILRAEMYY